jgi:hypothetical protein
MTMGGITKQACDVPHQRRPIPGGFVDQQLKQLMKELGEAINESLSDSESIAEVVARIKEGGYDIFLVLEATIGVSKQGNRPPTRLPWSRTLAEHQCRTQDQRSGSEVSQVAAHQDRRRRRRRLGACGAGHGFRRATPSDLSDRWAG